MKFVKPENSKNIEICFSDEEVQILNKTKKIILDPENYKIFGLNLIQVAMIMQDLDQL